MRMLSAGLILWLDMHATSLGTDWLSEHSAVNIKKLTELENGAVVESLKVTTIVASLKNVVGPCRV